MGLDNAQFVYLVDPQREDVVAREQRERMLHAIIKYDSPRQHFDSMSRAAAGPEEFSSFRAFDDEVVAVQSDTSSSSSTCSRSGRDTSTSMISSARQPFIEVTSPRRTSRVPSLNFQPDRRSPRPTADQRRKSLKMIMMMPTDVLSGLGEIEETLSAIDDDKKLLGLEEQAEAAMSARGPRHSVRNLQKSPHGSQRDASPRVSPHLPALAAVPERNFATEIENVLHAGFSAAETTSQMMRTIEETVEAMRVDLVGLFDPTLESHLRQQQNVVLQAVRAVKKLVADTVVPRWNEKNNTIQNQKDEIAAERRVSIQAKSEVSRLQAAMRKYGIVPAKWNVVSPAEDSCFLLCCDFPMVPTLWERDTPGVRASVKLIVELQRKLIREMKSGYEVANDGVSFLLAFSTGRAAVDWGLSFQSQLLGLSWPSSLLTLPECQPDAKLLWKGIRARIALHSGSVTSRFETESQTFVYHGEGVRVASSIMRYCPEGGIVASQPVLRLIEDLRSLATHGGAHGVPVDAEVEGNVMRLTRLVPHSLAQRLAAFADTGSVISKTPAYPAFLMLTLRPSDWSHCGQPAIMDMSTSNTSYTPHDGGESGPSRENDQVCVANEFPVAIEHDADNLSQLSLCLNLTTLPDKVYHVLESAEVAGVPVVTVFAQIIDANKAFARHQPSLLPTIRGMLKCVRKAVKGLTSGTDIACVGETASLIFASRTEAVTFVDRFLATFYSFSWDEETKIGWALAFPKSKEPTPDVVVGVHFGTLVNYSNPSLAGDVSDCFDALAQQNTETFTNLYASLTVSTVEGSASRLPPSELLLSGFAKNFDIACALASFALPGEAVFSAALQDACGVARTKSMSFIDLGYHSLQTPRYDGALFCGISASFKAKGGSQRSNASTVHSTVTAEGSTWPSSNTVQGLIAWVPMLHETHSTNIRAMTNLKAERSINQMRRPPKPREVVFVVVEALVPRAMWNRPKKFLILEALRVFQRCVRGLLTELDDGYEVFTDPQCFYLAFADQLKAFRFCSHIQDKLASAFWPPAFMEEFKHFVRRTEAPDGALLWSGLRARAAMVTPQRSNAEASDSAGGEVMAEVTVDVMPGTGTTAYFGKALRWCVALCSVAAFGQTLIDKTTSDNIQSSLSTIDGLTVDWAVSLSVPEKSTPLRGFNVKSQLLKARTLECSPSPVFGDGGFLPWFLLLRKDEASIEYVVAADVGGISSHAGRVSRVNSMLPAFVFDQPVTMVDSIAGDGVLTPDPFLRSATETGNSPAPLPFSTHVTPRQRRQTTVTPSRVSEDMVDLADYNDLLEEFNKAHRIIRGLLDIEQEFVRTYIFKEQMRHFRSEDEFNRIVVQACRDAGVKWGGGSDVKHTEKSLMTLCSAILPPDAVLVRNSHTGSETGRTHKTPRDRLRAGDVTTSMAGLLCQFHVVISRGARLRRKSSLVDLGAVGSADSTRARSRSITEAPNYTPRQSMRIQSSIAGDLGARAVDSSDSEDNEE